MKNTKEIYTKVLSSIENVSIHGQLNEKVLLGLQMTTSLYKHIEVITNYYDDEDHPEFNNWTDVEGMGYGWAWLRYDESRWHEMMSKMVAEESKGLLREVDDTYYVIYEIEGRKTFHFISSNDNGRRDSIITFSNDEIFY